MRTRSSLLTAILSVLSFASAAADTGDFIPIAPGEDIQAIVDRNPPGLTYRLRTGIHRITKKLWLKTGTILEGESGAVLSGAKPVTVWVPIWTPYGWRYAAPGQTQELPLVPMHGRKLEDLHFQEAAYPDDVFYDNRALRRVLSISLLAPGKFYFDYAHDIIWIADLPWGHNIEAAVAPGLILGGPAVNSITVRNLTVEKAAGYGIHFNQSPGWTVTNCVVRLNHTTGIYCGPRARVAGNRIYENGMYGIGGAGEDILIESNELWKNNRAMYMLTGSGNYWGAGAAKLVYTTRLIVRNNYSHHNIGDGFWLDINNRDPIIENNRFHYNEGSGFFYEISYRATIRNNRCIGNGKAGIFVASSPGCQIYNNYVYSDGTGLTGYSPEAPHWGGGIIVYQQGDRVHDGETLPPLEGDYLAQNNYVHHNTIVLAKGASGLNRHRNISFGREIYTSWGNRFDGNTYYVPDLANGRTFLWNDTTVTAEQWKAARFDRSGTFYQGIPSRPACGATGAEVLIVLLILAISRKVRHLPRVPVVLAILPIFSLPAFAATGDPVPIAPGEDINAAINRNPEGTPFLLRSGTHRVTQPIWPKTGNTFVGEPGAVLNGAKLVTLWIPVWTPTGLRYAAPGQTQQLPLAIMSGKPLEAHYFKESVYPDDVFYDGSALRRVLSFAQVAPGKFFFDYNNDVIWIADWPYGHVLEAAVSPGIILGSKRNNVWVSHVTLRNLVIEKSAAAGVGAWNCPNWTIENCELRWNHTVGCRVADRGVIRNNRVHHNGRYGLQGTGEDILVEGNEIWLNNWMLYMTGPSGGYWDSGASKFFFTTRLVVRNNYSHHNIGDGFWLDINNIDATIENNRFFENERYGFFYEISYRATIRDNFCIGNGGPAIVVASSPDCRVFDNYVYSDGVGLEGYAPQAFHHGGGIVIYQQGDREHDGETLPPKYGPYEARNNLVFRNTVVFKKGSGGLDRYRDTEFGRGIYTSWNNRFDSNTYYLSDLVNSRSFRWNDGTVTASSWKAAGQDLNGVFQQGIPSRPACGATGFEAVLGLALLGIFRRRNTRCA